MCLRLELYHPPKKRHRTQRRHALEPNAALHASIPIFPTTTCLTAALGNFILRNHSPDAYTQSVCGVLVESELIQKACVFRLYSFEKIKDTIGQHHAFANRDRFRTDSVKPRFPFLDPGITDSLPPSDTLDGAKVISTDAHSARLKVLPGCCASSRFVD